MNFRNLLDSLSVFSCFSLPLRNVSLCFGVGGMLVNYRGRAGGGFVINLLKLLIRRETLTAPQIIMLDHVG